MERKISVELYMLAFIIAAALFSAGVYVGTIINQDAMNAIDRNIASLNQRIFGVELLLLLEENDTSFCPVYRSELQHLDAEREEVGYRINLMEEERGFSSGEVKKDYMVLQAQSYLLAKKINEKCGDKYAIVMFFYDNKNCTDCKQAGDAILRARDGLPNKDRIRIYAFDGGIGSSIVEALEEKHGVKTHPTTIIGGTTYAGPVNEKTLMEAMGNAD